MDALDLAIGRLARRHGWTVEKSREEARRRIENAVADGLAGSQTAFDTIPGELEEIARAVFRRRLEAGEGAAGVEFVSGSTGLPLTGSGADR